MSSYQKLEPGKTKVDTFDISDSYDFRLGKQDYKLIFNHGYFDPITNEVINEHYQSYHFTYENKNKTTTFGDNFDDNHSY